MSILLPTQRGYERSRGGLLVPSLRHRPSQPCWAPGLDVRQIVRIAVHTVSGGPDVTVNNATGTTSILSVPDVDQNDGLIVGMIWHGGSGAITSVQCSNESNLSPLGAASGPVTAISDASLQLFSLDQVTQAGTNTKTITANFEAEHGGSPTGFALAVAGGNNAGWFDTGTLQFATGNSNTPTVNVAPSVANTLLVALCVNRAGAATQGAGFTLMNPDDNHWNDDAQYQLDGGAAGSRAVTMSLGAADEWAMLVAALKPAGAGAATNPGQSWQQRGAMGVRVMM
jgi:hypothetical protein